MPTPTVQRVDIQRATLLALTGRPDRVAWSAFSSSDWERLLAMARAEGVAPLLYHALATAGWPDSTPGRVHRELQELYYNTAARNLLIYHELVRIFTALREAGERPTMNDQRRRRSVGVGPSSLVVLKGAALAATVYPSVALRPLGDVDLLVPREHLEMAIQVLEALGYRPAYPEISPGLNLATGYHVVLRSESEPAVTVELHWGLVAGNADWRSPPLDWFWEQTEPLPKYPIPNTQSPTFILTPTAHLLYLAAHLMLQHGGAQARLLWFYDLHLLLTRCADRLDWDELLKQAEAFRWAAALRAALQGVRERFGTPLPHGVLDALAQTDDRQALRLVQRKAGPQTRAAGFWEALTCLDWRARFRLAWGVVCPSPTYMRWRYKPQPAWLWPLCYPYRWFDMLRDGLATLRRMVRERRRRGTRNASSLGGESS